MSGGEANGRTFSDSWHRVASVRVTLRTSVRAHRQMFRGREWVMLRDTLSADWFRVWVEAEAFRAAGGFGTEYYAGEEVFLSRRLKTLARRSGRRFVILARHPLHTSSRKLKLYTLTEAGRFFFRMLFTAAVEAQSL